MIGGLAVVIIIFIIGVAICARALLKISENNKKAVEWNNTGVDTGTKMENEQITELLSKLKVPEEKDVQYNEQGIIIVLNKTSYKAITQVNEEGNTIVRFALADGAKSNIFNTTEIVWLYEYFRDAVKNTDYADAFYKKSNNNASLLLLGVVVSVICVFILIFSSLFGEDKLKKQIMNSSPEEYPDVTYQEAFESFWAKDFLHKPKWLLTEDDLGNKTLTFYGELKKYFEELGCESIEIVLDVGNEIRLEDVVIYGDLESLVVPYERNLSPTLDSYVVEFLFEYARGLDENDPQDPLSWAFIKMVQRGSLESYPNIVLGDAFANLFAESYEWKYFLSDEGKDIVEFNGMANGISAKMQFVINENCENFSLDYMEVDGESFGALDSLIVLNGILANYSISNSIDGTISTQKIRIDVNDYISQGKTAGAMAEEMINTGYDIVYLENYDAYGFAEENLIMQNYDIGVYICAEYSESATISFAGLTTDMSLREADSYLIDSLGAEDISLPDDNAWRYKIDDTYYITLYGAPETGIIFELEVFWESYQ